MGDGSTVMAGSASVSTPDIDSSNGVIHVIDAVLLPPVPDIVETAISAGSFTVLVEALQTAGLVDALKGAGPFTVFAPTDAAFTALLDSLGMTKAELLARDDLADILKYHVLSGSSVKSADLAAAQEVTTLEGSNLTVTKEGSTVKAGSASVSTPDIDSSNGVIHAINAGSFTVLVEALQTAGLVDALKGAGPFTVFAPTDAAFTALLNSLGVTKTEVLARDGLADILKYHVLSGSSVMSADLAATQDVTTLEGSTLTVTKEGSTVKAGSASVSAADIECSNGVIHVIDAVLLPSELLLPPVLDIVETAISAGNFTVLVEALQTAGLVDALKGAGPFTVFAPTDAAFTALLDSLGVTKAELLARDDLADILKYHMLSGSSVMSADLAAA